jgi:hypothetical protein
MLLKQRTNGSVPLLCGVLGYRCAMISRNFFVSWLIVESRGGWFDVCMSGIRSQ